MLNALCIVNYTLLHVFHQQFGILKHCYEAEDEEQCLGICLGFGDVDEVHKLVGGDGQLKLPVLETHLHWYCFALMVEGEAQALVVFGAYVSAFKIFARNPLIKRAVILEHERAACPETNFQERRPHSFFQFFG